MTSAGSIFEKHAKHFVSTYEKMLSELQDFSRVEKGLIKIATIPILAQYDIAKVISRFQEQYPGIKIHFEESENAKIIPALEQVQYNFAILLTNNIIQKSYHIWPVAHDALTLVTSTTHPLANKKTYRFKNLKMKNSY